MQQPPIQEKNFFKGELGQYHLLETADGSHTLYSEFFQEGCHSLDGAQGEVCHKFLNACEVVTKFSILRPLHILEVGLGPGLALRETSSALLHWMGIQGIQKAPHVVTYYAFELDALLAKHALMFFGEEINEGVETFGVPFYSMSLKGMEVKVWLGDAVSNIGKLKESRLFHFDVIYQDPFSPKKNPALWTSDWFRALREVSDPEVILSTYSSSGSVLRALKEAGWNPETYAAFGRKKSSTKATLNPSCPT